MKSIEDAARDYQRSDESDGTTATAFEHGAEWMWNELAQERETALSIEFDCGWWCCFNTFAAHLLSYRRHLSPSEQDINDVLKAAGFPAREITDALGNPNIGFDHMVAQWLQDYLDTLK